MTYWGINLYGGSTSIVEGQLILATVWGINYTVRDVGTHPVFRTHACLYGFSRGPWIFTVEFRTHPEKGRVLGRVHRCRTRQYTTSNSQKITIPHLKRRS